MANGWNPSGAWMAAFRKALADAFDEPSMELLTTDYFTRSFAKISPAGFGKTFEFRVQELINNARMEDWLLDLVAAARERRPKNAAIASIAENLGLTIAGPRLNNQTGKTLEEVIQDNAKFINPTVFQERLPELEGQVCWVDIPGGGGTGFLVGPDLVLDQSARHRADLQNLASASDVTCRFDYRQALDGSVPTKKSPITVGLDANWLVDSQPPSQFDWDPALGEAADTEKRLRDPEAGGAHRRFAQSAAIRSTRRRATGRGGGSIPAGKSPPSPPAIRCSSCSTRKVSRSSSRSAR